MAMAMVTNKPGPQRLVPDSPAPASAAAERGQLVPLVTPVPLLLIPTEVSKVLARGLLKKRPPLPRLRPHPLLKLLQLLMDFLSSDMVFPLFTTTPASNGPVLRPPESK